MQMIPVLSKQVLKERLREVEKMPLLFLKKIYIQWFRSDLSWTFNTGEYPVLFSISNFINQMMIVLFHSLALSSLLFLKEKKLFANIINDYDCILCRHLFTHRSHATVCVFCSNTRGHLSQCDDF